MEPKKEIYNDAWFYIKNIWMVTDRMNTGNASTTMQTAS